MVGVVGIILKHTIQAINIKSINLSLTHLSIVLLLI